MFKFLVSILVAKVFASAKGNCNFEADTCSWSNSKNDTFDWTRTSGGTVSSGTGPSSDHTFGNTTGHYVYIESSAPRLQGDNAILQSETLSAVTNCMQFYYNMYGTGIGTLNIWVAGNKIWSLTGNQGTGWKQGQVNVGQNSTYQVLFEAVRGKSYHGDIALDDVMFVTQSCTLTPSSADPSLSVTLPPPVTPFIGNCNTGLCNWTQDSTDDFDWTQHQGSTGSSGTGPHGDHTSGNGYYMYIETSAPRKPGDKARLISPTINGASPMCLTFWYHMYGSNINSLNIYLSHNGTLGTAVWTGNGNKGDKWLQESFNIAGGNASLQETNVVIEGACGSGYQGDIAVDDVSLTTGQCTVSPFIGNCDTGLCNWTQDSTDDFDWTRHRGSTASVSTGPHGDHTSGNGYYMYIETSARKPGDKARLISPTISGAAPICLTFWYHMYGSDINSLNIYLSHNSTLGTAVWTRNGNQGDKWLKGSFSIAGGNASLQETNVVVEGVCGSSYQGDIAVDDVSVTTGHCIELVPVGKRSQNHVESWIDHCWHHGSDKKMNPFCALLYETNYQRHLQ